jgi:hypothetical protein
VFSDTIISIIRITAWLEGGKMPMNNSGDIIEK